MAEWDLAEKINKRLVVFAVIAGLIVLVVLGVLNFSQKLNDSEFETRMAQAETENMKVSLRASEENVRILEEKLKAEEKELEAVSSSLNSKNEELMEIKEKSENEHLPKKYPMRGNGAIVLPEEDEIDKDNPLPETAVYFKMFEGSKAVATGNGNIDSITEDEKYGTLIEIDHGNGYHSYYYGKGLVMVEQGQEIDSGEVLIYFTEDDHNFVYLIKNGSEYVDPMELMDISG
ncbi:MAG: M23 family metallopeptidase [Lachnospiraceae bacterium]|nr:M23 family metallopeptidase [Lachnospiraceae bacterium]